MAAVVWSGAVPGLPWLQRGGCGEALLLLTASLRNDGLPAKDRAGGTDSLLNWFYCFLSLLLFIFFLLTPFLWIHFRVPQTHLDLHLLPYSHLPVPFPVFPTHHPLPILSFLPTAARALLPPFLAPLASITLCREESSSENHLPAFFPQPAPRNASLTCCRAWRSAPVVARRTNSTYLPIAALFMCL